jgi:ribonuclease HI
MMPRAIGHELAEAPRSKRTGGRPLIVAYIDGSCRKHTSRRGGWAVHVVGGDEYVGAVENTTNQRMELLAACVALERTDGDSIQVLSQILWVDARSRRQAGT